MSKGLKPSSLYYWDGIEWVKYNPTDGSAKTQIVDLAGNIAEIDGVTKTLQTMNYEHHEIHEGNHYNYADYDNDVASSEIINFVMTTPNTATRIHFYFNIFSSLGATLELFEGTVATGGASIAPRNNERNSDNESTVTLVKDPTITNDGVRASGFLVGANREAGMIDRDREFVLKQNTSYLVRITSLANSNGISWDAEWYEHT